MNCNHEWERVKHCYVCLKCDGTRQLDEVEVRPSTPRPAGEAPPAQAAQGDEEFSTGTGGMTLADIDDLSYPKPEAAQVEPVANRASKIEAALALLKQDYSPECLKMASTREYVEDAVQTLIGAGYTLPQQAKDEGLEAAAKVVRARRDQIRLSDFDSAHEMNAAISAMADAELAIRAMKGKA